MRKISLLMGIGLLLVLSPFHTVFANEFDPTGPFKVYGPQTDERYLYFGDDSNCEYEPCMSRHESNGLSVTVDEASISHQSIRAVVTMDLELIDHRNIDTFEILLNGNRVVDGFDVYWDNWTLENRRYYQVTVTAGTEYTGARMYFQVVGLSDNGQGEMYVVAWSNYTGTYEFKPFPTVDRDAISVLERIYQKLNELLNTLSDKLDKLTKAVEDAYKPSEQAKNNLDRAMNNFMDKLPMEDMIDTMTEFTDEMERAKQGLQLPGEKITIGDSFYFIPGVEASKVDELIDLTEFQEQVLLFRRLMEVMIWLFFFQMIMHMLTPKPRI